MDYNPTPRTLLEGEAGLTIMPMGIVKLRESKAYFDNVLLGKDNGADPERTNTVNTAFRHETVHHIQSFTTAFVFKHCEEIRRFSYTFLKDIKQGGNIKDILGEARPIFKSIMSDLYSESSGISAIQLMEGAAVIEAHRSQYPIQNVNELWNFMQIVSTLSTTYSRTLNIMNIEFGPIPMFNLTSTLCYLALNAPKPGDAFIIMVKELANLPPSQVEKMSAVNLFEMFAPKGLDESLLSMAKRGERISKTNLWSDIAKNFADCGELTHVHLAAANPSSLFAKTKLSDKLDVNLLRSTAYPLIIMFQDGLGRINDDMLDEKQAEALFQATSLVGAVIRLMRGKDEGPFVPCTKDDCPVKETRLCHYHYPPKPGDDFSACSFHELFKKHFKKEAFPLFNSIYMMDATH